MGKGILFRADKVHHSGEMVYTTKRAITLFINIKKTQPIEDTQEEHKIPEVSVIRNVEMSSDMQ